MKPVKVTIEFTLQAVDGDTCEPVNNGQLRKHVGDVVLGDKDSWVGKFAEIGIKKGLQIDGLCFNVTHRIIGGEL